MTAPARASVHLAHVAARRAASWTVADTLLQTDHTLDNHGMPSRADLIINDPCLSEAARGDRAAAPAGSALSSWLPLCKRQLLTIFAPQAIQEQDVHTTPPSLTVEFRQQAEDEGKAEVSRGPWVRCDVQLKAARAGGECRQCASRCHQAPIFPALPGH